MSSAGKVVLGCTAATLLTWWLTGVVRKYALARAMLDFPSDRSSHTVPTPRGGGLAIAVASLAGIAVVASLGWITSELAIGLVPAGAGVAAVGWLDDRRQVRPAARVAVHVLVAAWAVLWLGGFPAITLGPNRLWWEEWGAAIATVGIVWCINLYNFMDGIDGLAGIEAASVGAIAGALLWMAGDRGLATIAFLVAAAAVGFLPWNWSPPRIFMGDVGSGLLGFLFGALAVAAENARALPLPVAALLLGVFVFDATATLVRRVARRERWYSAHRSHAYQRAVQTGLRHSTVALAVLAVNLVLGALAWYAVRRPAMVPACLLVGAAGLAAFYLVVERRMPMGYHAKPNRVSTDSV